MHLRLLRSKRIDLGQDYFRWNINNLERFQAASVWNVSKSAAFQLKRRLNRAPRPAALASQKG
jgi:hypothetical protein